MSSATALDSWDDAPLPRTNADSIVILAIFILSINIYLVLNYRVQIFAFHDGCVARFRQIHDSADMFEADQAANLGPMPCCPASFLLA
jgi:hypothetical protein